MNYFWFYKSDDEWKFFSSKKKAMSYANDNGYELNKIRGFDEYIVMGTDANFITITKEYVE